MVNEVIKSIISDFDNILVVEVKTGEVLIQQSREDQLDWLTDSIKDGYNGYIENAVKKYLFPEDKDWINNIIQLDNIVQILSNEGVYFLNFRSKNDNKTIFYQLKFTRIGDNEHFDKFTICGHSIDESERLNLRHMEEVATAHHNAVIASLAGDFDYIGYYNKKTEHIRLFHASPVFENVIKTINPNLRSLQRLQLFFEKIVYEEDWEDFSYQIKKENVFRGIENGAYEIHFRAKFNDSLYYYKVKFVQDSHEPNGVVFALMSFDEQVRSKLLHREQEKNREIIEKQLEMIITERTADILKKNKALNRLNEDIIELIGDITEARDLESGEHIRRVKGITHILATQIMQDYPEYELTHEKIELIASASALHDIGKISIPDAILLKPGRLTQEEFEIMKTHTTKGPELLRKAPKDWSSAYLETSMEICHFHHEKYDGNGYPIGLKGEDIPLSAQIVSIADCYDALVSRRVYKEAFSPDIAVKMIIEGQCGAFSPKLIKSFKKCVPQFDKLELSVSDSFNAFHLNVVEKLANKRILLVEDDEMNRMIGREMLEGEGAIVIEASSGTAALDVINTVSEGTISAILMDVMMPGLDGPSTAKIIRNGEKPWGKTVPIIGISASDDEEIISRCYESGMNAYLKKPVRISELTNTILQSIID